MSKQVKKAIITAGGWGTRFLPITKAIPKEMIPIGNYPMIYYFLKECKDSGIEQVGIVVREREGLTEQYFMDNPYLDEHLRRNGKEQLADSLKDVEMGLDITFIQQKNELPYGHGCAVYSAREWVGEDDFVMMFGDDLVVSDVPAVAQLLKTWEMADLGGLIMTVGVPQEEIIGKLSSVKYEDHEVAPGVKLIADYIEKPKSPEEVFTNELYIGRAVFSAKLFEHLEEVLRNHQPGNEFYTWDGASMMRGKEGLAGQKLDGTWQTTNSPQQMWEAQKLILGKLYDGK